MRAQWVCSRERRIALYKQTSINDDNSDDADTDADEVDVDADDGRVPMTTEDGDKDGDKECDKDAHFL